MLLKSKLVYCATATNDRLFHYVTVKINLSSKDVRDSLH